MRQARPRLVAVMLGVLVAGCGQPPGDRGTPTTAPVSSTTLRAATSTAVGPGTTTTTSVPTFAWSASPLDTATRALMTGKTWQPGCPVSLDDLRLVTLGYWGFDGIPHSGQLVVNADSVTPLVEAFRALYQSRFPIRRMRLVDYYGGDDERSMAADNTSAFNCRLVPRSSTWSQHAYGRAVDIDPLENPEIRNGQVDPPSARPWTDRQRTDPGMIDHGDAAWRAFHDVGWTWGGDWVSLKDYMHFSANGL